MRIIVDCKLFKIIFYSNRYWPKNLSNLTVTPIPSELKSEDLSSSSSCSTPISNNSSNLNSSQILFNNSKNERINEPTKKIKLEEKKTVRNSKSETSLVKNTLCIGEVDQSKADSFIKKENSNLLTNTDSVSLQSNGQLFFNQTIDFMNQSWLKNQKNQAHKDLLPISFNRNTTDKNQETSKDKKLCNGKILTNKMKMIFNLI